MADLKADSFKIILTAINHKLNMLNKRPTHIVHDILEFFVKIHSSIDSTLLISEVIPAVTQLLRCSNQLVKNDALNCVNILILYVSQTISDQNSSNSNDIYYDTENISLSNQQLANANLTIFDIDKPSQTSSNHAQTTDDYSNVCNICVSLFNFHLRTPRQTQIATISILRNNPLLML